MDFKFGKKNSGDDEQVSLPEKKSQTGLLLLLLILLGGFGYFYFFTDLIRPQEQPAPPPPPPQVVKQPLPARDATTAVADAVLDQKDKGATGQKPPVEQKKQPSAADSKVSERSASAPAATLPEKNVATKGTGTSPETAKNVKPEDKKGEAKPVAQVKPEQVVDKVPAKPATTAPAAEKRVASEPVKSGPWNLVAGLYLVEELLAADIAKVKKAGFTPLLTSGPRRPVTMYRLFYKEYGDKEESKSGIELLRGKGGDGFLMQHDGKYDLYAGSFALQTGAKEEQRRLATAGINVSIRQVQVVLPSRKLSAGMFTDRKVASDALARLKNVGISNAFLE